MKKIFCDIKNCNNEIGTNIAPPLIQSQTSLTLAGGDKIKLAINLIASPAGFNTSDFDVCLHCAIDAINKLDKRPLPIVYT